MSAIRQIAITGLLALLPSFVVSGLHAELKLVPRTTVVHLDETRTDTLYNFLTAVPAAVYHKGGDVYQGVLLGDGSELKPNVYLMQDWSSYLAAGQSKSELVLVGQVSEQTRESFRAGLGTQTVKEIKDESPVDLANTMAKQTFSASRIAVLAPYVAAATEADIEGAANAAARASVLNAPLFLMAPGSLAPQTLDTLKELGVKDIVVIDVNGQIADSALSGLAESGITVSAHIKTLKDAVTAQLTGTSSSTICFTQDSPKAMAAAIAAARYQGVVLRVPATAVKAAVKSYAAIPNMLLNRTRKLDRPYNMADYPVNTKDEDIVDAVYTSLASVGADNPAALESILTFATGSEYSGVLLTMDRGLVGDPRKPESRGALTGRFPGSAQENIAYVNRSTLYRGLIFSNPRPTRVNMLMVAYEAENTSPDCTLRFEDAAGKEHLVNEFYGGHEQGKYDDAGVYETLKARNYNIGFHSGRNGTQAHDPLNNEEAYGFWKELKDGLSYFYISSHGSTNAFYPLAEDNGLCMDIDWGAQYWPSLEGRVNNYGDEYSAENFDQDYENLHSSVNIFNACLVGGGSVNSTLMNHGAAASISSYISVSFNGAGFFCCLFSDHFSRSGTSIGQAYAQAMAVTSQIWPTGQMSGDSSLRFVLFGDPNMEYIKTDWTRPAPTAVDAQRTGGQGDARM